ncbi:MAG: hypothetical protein JNK43_04310 [Ignavibacteria bacterium]|nr:hypothetical protein [Ignavibacteria bacterium]
MLKFLKKLFDAEVTVAPVVSVNDEEIKTYDTVAEAIADLESDDKLSDIKENKIELENSKIK